MKQHLLAACLLVISACSNIQNHDNNKDTIVTVAPIDSAVNTNTLNNQTSSQTIVDYAKTLIGVPYKYASTDPREGFDCSGFITYVFQHFGIPVPRSSVEFTNAYPEVPVANAEQGDLILFTGTDSTDGKVGHMGIIVSNVQDSIQFIHSTSGAAHGVTITPLNTYYKSRFVKIIRVPLDK